ncbi:hypothetical protein [Arthrobacter sp. zg-Y750]|uniref:hypothetical protein n=1 Tax=Arthrobacter sp. zg-Y750 TaxID=2894189 RepID=UPI001E4F9909|nr:hypothetical protein [Arthrobacter sp. zg-Y750]MCC9176669.1 hypothetical protein [Arthrobacter sp. zg-Y750]
MKEDAMTPGPENLTPPVADGGMPVPPPPPAAPVNTAPAAPYVMEPYRTAPDPVSPRRNYALFAGAGLVLGLGAGFLLAQIDFSSEPEPSVALTNAVSSCGVEDTTGIELGDEGQSLTMDSEGKESYGADFADITCVLDAIDIPDSVSNRMNATRSLDGRLTAEWDEFAASWSYHPDSGMNVVIEILEPSED